MDNVKVSVIVSTYNSIEWLSKVLEGYKNQTYPYYEVIIADDGSKEDTKQLIESYQENYL